MQTNMKRSSCDIAIARGGPYCPGSNNVDVLE